MKFVVKKLRIEGNGNNVNIRKLEENGRVSIFMV